MKHIAYNCIDVSEFSEGLAAIRNSDGVGFINTNGELVIPTVFEDVEPYWNTMLNTRYMFKKGFLRFDEAFKTLGARMLKNFAIYIKHPPRADFRAWGISILLGAKRLIAISWRLAAGH